MCYSAVIGKYRYLGVKKYFFVILFKNNKNRFIKRFLLKITTLPYLSIIKIKPIWTNTSRMSSF